MAEAEIQAAVRALSEALPGINATRYLTAAGVVVLLYDHLLLLAPEVRIVWKAKWSITKGLFLYNRYFVLACLLLNAHMLSGLSQIGLSTPVIWLPTTLVFGITSLAIANVFIVQRVWALWGRNDTILAFLVGVFVCVYVASYTITAFIIADLIPDVSYLPILRTCILTRKPTLFIAMYGVPMILDVFVFVLTCWNAFDRPRHMQTALAKQLVTDGIVYFFCILSLRLVNILALAFGDISLTQLAAYFLWAMITVLINRMLLVNGTVQVHPGPDPSGRETPFHVTHDVENDVFGARNDPIDLRDLPSFIELDIKPMP